jgi:glycosyltransferase involved in cell wall biosynthesis
MRQGLDSTCLGVSPWSSRMMEQPLDVTVLIATYNRAALLAETLDSVARLRTPAGWRWEVIVVDNNSADDTRSVVERYVATFPVRLRYLFESQQGRSSALNTGIAAAAGRVIAFTDDDVRVDEGWLEHGCRPLLEGGAVTAYTGGPVRPIWGAPPPAWFDLKDGHLWGTIAIQDHGSRPFVYEEGGKVPLGANMAVRKSLFDAVGGFRPDLGRSGGRLVLGQEVPELLLRARNAGVHGLYVPEMQLHHHIPAARLTRCYFRRWWFGKGVSRAALHRIHPRNELGVDVAAAPHVLGVPRFMYGSALRALLAWCRAALERKPEVTFRHQMRLAYFCGYFWTRVRERGGRTAAPRSRPWAVQ